MSLLLLFRSGVPSSLVTGLVAHWKMEEASGTRADSHDSLPLTASASSPTQATGKVGSFAAQFTKASFQYLLRSTTTDFRPGDSDFTVSAWVYADSLPSHAIILSKDNPTGNQREYALGYLSSSGELYWRVSSDGLIGVNSTTRPATTFGPLATGTWYHVVAYHDSVNNLIGIRVNGVLDTSFHGTGVFQSTSEFRVGALGDGTLWWDGRIDSVSYWNRMLTPREQFALYALGSGLEYPFIYTTVVGILWSKAIVTPAGAIARLAAKALAGSLGTVGTLTRGVRKTLSGAIAPSSTVATQRGQAVALGGTLGLAGALTKRVLSRMSGALGLSGYLWAGPAIPPPVDVEMVDSGRRTTLLVSSGRTSVRLASTGRSSVLKV